MGKVLLHSIHQDSVAFKSKGFCKNTFIGFTDSRVTDHPGIWLVEGRRYRTFPGHIHLHRHSSSRKCTLLDEEIQDSEHWKRIEELGRISRRPSQFDEDSHRIYRWDLPIPTIDEWKERKRYEGRTWSLGSFFSSLSSSNTSLVMDISLMGVAPFLARATIDEW